MQEEHVPFEVRNAVFSLETDRRLVDSWFRQIKELKHGRRPKDETRRKSTSNLRAKQSEAGERMLNRIRRLGEIGHLHPAAVDALLAIKRKAPEGYLHRVHKAVVEAHAEISGKELPPEFEKKMRKLGKALGIAPPKLPGTPFTRAIHYIRKALKK